MRAVGKANRGRSAADFLDRDDMLQIAKAKAAIGFVHSQAMKPEFTHGRPQFLARKPVISVDFRREWGDFVGCETVSRIADHVRVFAKGEF